MRGSISNQFRTQQLQAKIDVPVDGLMATSQDLAEHRAKELSRFNYVTSYQSAYIKGKGPHVAVQQQAPSLPCIRASVVPNESGKYRMTKLLYTPDTTGMCCLCLRACECIAY
jgi:hypothetical protein